MGFSHYIYENELTSENMYLPMNLAKKEQISSLILQNRFPESKISLEYLTLIIVASLDVWQY